MIFLIDYENTGNNGFIGIETLSNTDKIIVFYTERAQSLTIDTHRKIEASEVQKEYIRTSVGSKNALDFQLSTYLGYLIANNSSENYAIISKDKGYSFVTDFWNSKDINIYRYINLKKDMVVDNTSDSPSVVANLTVQESNHNSNPVPATDTDLATILADYPTEVPKIHKIINTYKTKQGINNALVKAYGSDKAGHLYKIIKPFLKDKKGR